MRRSLLIIGSLVLGLSLLVSGFLYDVQYAGIPYQDPTDARQVQYNHASAIASGVMSAGIVLVLAGLLLPIYQFIEAVRRRMSNRA
jgi:hypothetical protein